MSTNVPQVDDFVARQRAERVEHNQELTARLVNALTWVAPQSVTTSTTFQLPTPMDIALDINRDKVRVYAITVQVTRYNQVVDSDDDRQGYINVTARTRALTAKGGVDQRTTTESWQTLPDQLAAPLLLAAMTVSNFPS